MTKGPTGSYNQSLATAMDHFLPWLYMAGPRRLALKETEERLIYSDKP